MSLLRRRMVVLAKTAVVAFALCGCVTSDKYKLAKEAAPPARLLGWNVSAPPVELLLETLIVYKGPGSWKFEARWDEYVVLLINRGDQPVRIDTVTLLDLQGRPQVPGDDPWKLEKLTYTNWDNYGKAGMDLLAGAGVATMYTGSVVMLGFFGAMSVAALSALLIAAPVAMVVDVTAVAVINQNNMDKVQLEFQRRRMVLPKDIAPGSSSEGSFFFPMTPGPQRLILKGQVGEEPLELVLELPKLSDLHINRKETK